MPSMLGGRPLHLVNATLTAKQQFETIPNKDKRTGRLVAYLSFYGLMHYSHGTHGYPVGTKKNYFLTAASLFLNLSTRPPASTNFCLPV